jgi:hypothetical protein
MNVGYLNILLIPLYISWSLSSNYRFLLMEIITSSFLMVTTNMLTAEVIKKLKTALPKIAVVPI